MSYRNLLHAENQQDTKATIYIRKFNNLFKIIFFYFIGRDRNVANLFMKEHYHKNTNIYCK